MPEGGFLALVHNASLLLALALVYDLATTRWRADASRLRQVPVGLAVGGIGVAVMLSSWTLEPGIVFDTRSILLGVTGLYFGTVPTVIAMAVTATFRIWMGGAATLTGVSVIVASGCIGLLWRYRRRSQLAELNWVELIALGLAVHVAMLGLMFTLGWQSALRVLTHITLPILLIYPPATAALGLLMANRLRRERDAGALREREEQARASEAALRRSEGMFRELNAELESRVSERTAQLEEANKELEAFSYSVSHDLRAPLRAIDGFSRMIVEDHAEGLDPEGRRLLGVVSANARRMAQLIDALLRLSRLGRSEVRCTSVDMASLAHAAFEEIVESPEARGRIEFRVGDLPSAMGDPALLMQVWVNLLSNAVKFTSNRERPVIEVDGEVEGRGAVYRVKDNGAGFNMAYAGKLFGVFQRLHGPGEFEGTGVGLALVRRIVLRHGGRVWAEGKVGEGATFFFALPAS